MLKVYANQEFAPESVFDPEYGVESTYEVYGDDSTDNYDKVLREESEFDGIRGVQEYLAFLMTTDVFIIKAREAHGYTPDPDEERELEFKYQLSGGFGDWHWDIEYDWSHDCLVFKLGHDD